MRKGRLFLENLDTFRLASGLHPEGLGTAFLESNRFALLLAELVGLRVSDNALSALPRVQLPPCHLSSLGSEVQELLGNSCSIQQLSSLLFHRRPRFSLPTVASRCILLDGNLKTPSMSSLMTPALLTL